MAEEPSPKAEKQTRRSRRPAALGLLLAVVLGGAGFYAAYSGLIPASGGTEGAYGGSAPEALPAIAFVPIAPLVISLGPESRHRHLRFSGELEVPEAYADDVRKVMPRVLDVLNSYLRAVDARQFDEPGVLIRLRAQMLRRVELVVGDGRVRDLLVTEFLLN